MPGANLGAAVEYCTPKNFTAKQRTRDHWVSVIVNYDNITIMLYPQVTGVNMVSAVEFLLWYAATARVVFLFYQWSSLYEHCAASILINSFT